MDLPGGGRQIPRGGLHRYLSRLVNHLPRVVGAFGWIGSPKVFQVFMV